MVFRLVDTKVDEMNAEQAVESLKEERPDLYGKDVYATRLYLLTGEIEARDCLEEWFDGATDFKISKGASRSINQANDESSPIFLGNTRTNQFMREILKEDGNICIFKYTTSSSAWWRSETQLQKRSRACEPVVQKAPSSLVKLSYFVNQPQHGVFAVVTRIRESFWGRRCHDDLLRLYMFPRASCANPYRRRGDVERRRRWQRPALFLPSDDFSYCVGVEIVVDGGMTQLVNPQLA